MLLGREQMLVRDNKIILSVAIETMALLGLGVYESPHLFFTQVCLCACVCLCFPVPFVLRVPACV
jgi:hypothetical protein